MSDNTHTSPAVPAPGKLNPNKLWVAYRPQMTPTEPVINRHYTLTHSDITAELFLTVAPQSANDLVNETRDEVLAEWRLLYQQYYLSVSVYVDGQFGPKVSAIRYGIFQRELPLALHALRYGDRFCFEAHPELDAAPVWIYFQSNLPQYNQCQYWGTPADYRVVL